MQKLVNNNKIHKYDVDVKEYDFEVNVKTKNRNIRRIPLINLINSKVFDDILIYKLDLNNKEEVDMQYLKYKREFSLYPNNMIFDESSRSILFLEKSKQQKNILTEAIIIKNLRVFEEMYNFKLNNYQKKIWVRLIQKNIKSEKILKNKIQQTLIKCKFTPKIADLIS